jgi:hypothetical protein
VLSDQPDTITWKWTRDGSFSVAFGYDCQFLGAVHKIPVWMCGGLGQNQGANSLHG